MWQVRIHQLVKIILAIATFAWACECAASYRFVTLEELARDSEIVVMVKQERKNTEAPRMPDKSQHVIVRAFKGGSVGAEILMCPQRDSEAYDFTDGPALFVLFAKKNGQCFQPIAGRRGVVEIEGEQAYTVNFLDEPNWQALSDFIQKTEKEVLRTSKKGKAKAKTKISPTN